MLKKIKNKIQERRARKKAHLHAILNAPSAYDEAILSWVAPETIKHERGLLWKINISVVLVLFIIGGIIYNAWTFSLAIIVFAVVYYLVHLEHPKDVEIKISKVGIKVGSKKYPYSRVKAFWVLYDPPFVKTLNIRVNGEIINDLTIQLNGQDPSEVREVLMEQIPELEGQHEKLTDIFLRLFKI